MPGNLKSLENFSIFESNKAILRVTYLYIKKEVGASHGLRSKPSFEVTPSHTLEATSEDSTVLTIALALAHTIVQPQSIRSQLNCLNKSFTGCLNI
jgi:hypothetical protein